MSTYLYERADTIRPGDILPEVSTSRVARVTVFPNEHVRVTFERSTFVKWFAHGGPDFGFPAARIERAS